MKKILTFIGTMFKTLKAKVIGLAAVVTVAVLVAIILALTSTGHKANIEPLIMTLQESSELTTAELTYKGFAEFQDEGTIFINRSDFKMKYTATARIGIDIQRVEIAADNAKKVIYISVPKAEVLDVKVDATSIQYFDEKFSLFNTDKKEDSNRAIAFAEQQTKEELAAMGSLKMADDQAATLIKGLLANAIPKGYRIEVK